MSLVTREAKGAALTHAEMDENLKGLNLQGYAMSEAEFMVLGAANRDKFAGSGFVEWGKHPDAANAVNEGLTAYHLVSNLLLLGLTPKAGTPIGTSKTGWPIVNVSGVVSRIYSVGLNDGGNDANKIVMPDAPDSAALPERQDLVYVRTKHQKISTSDFVYPYGIKQSLLTTEPSTGLTTVTGEDTLFGIWQAVGALKGKGLVWSTMSDADKQKFSSDPDNNIYHGKDGEFYQVQLDIQVYKGTGAEGQDYDLTAIGYTQDSVDKGLYVSGEYSAVPVCLVSRRNSGAYHPVFNPNGTKDFLTRVDTSDNHFAWYVSGAKKPFSRADCFEVANDGNNVVGDVAPFARTWSGHIASGNTGRPDGLFYDGITAGDIKDLRNSAHKPLSLKRTREKSLSEMINGTKRGWEGAARMMVAATGVVESGTTGDISITSVRFDNAADVGEFITIVNQEGRHVISGYIRIKYVNDTLCSVSDTYANALANVGAVSLSRVNGDVYTILKSEKGTLPFKTNLHCDIIGDPANYPQDWIENGVAGNALVLGENGEDYIPNGTSKEFKFSKKYKEMLLRLRSADNGVTWSTVAATATNSSNSVTFSAAATIIEMWFYTTESDPFETADNTEVVNLGSVTGMNRDDIGQLTSNLIGKIAVDSGGYNANQVPLVSYEIELTGELHEATDGRAPTHDTLPLLANRSTGPAVKTLNYLTRENGKLYLQMLFKEMIYDANFIVVTRTIEGGVAFATVPEGTIFKLEGFPSSALNGQVVQAAANISGTTWSTTVLDGHYIDAEGVIRQPSGVVWSIMHKVFDGNGWGDDNKFNVVDGVSTSTDDNGNITLVGQKRIKLPYFIGDAE